ncbi:hypothetical protein L840_1796 [Mycobacterium sp. MAC_011194_8550]|nr:hypothetical protein L840_1796 [Mycobacterium sp. MAC_011194_8550]
MLPAKFDDIAVHPAGATPAADFVTALQHCDIVPSREQPSCSCQTCEARPRDDHLHLCSSLRCELALDRETQLTDKPQATK